jgi:signal peptide peptidase SppA
VKLARIATRLYATPWHILPEAHRRLQSLFEAHQHQPISSFLTTENDGDQDDMEEKGYDIQNGVAIVPVNGVIGKRLNMLEMMCGGADVDQLVSAVQKADSDPMVESILLDVNSPGGMVTGTPEAAAALGQIEKPLYAFTDSQMCSAAYWLASAATSGIFVTGSSDVGSIGTYLAMIDSSRAYEMEGLKLELFKAGSLKAIGLEGKAFTDAERTFLQDGVDRANARFTGAVVANRKEATGRVISDATMQGQWFDGEQAVANGLADQLVSGLGEAIGLISGSIDDLDGDGDGEDDDDNDGI